jgi:Nucleoside diphosphate kinase
MKVWLILRRLAALDITQGRIGSHNTHVAQVFQGAHATGCMHGLARRQRHEYRPQDAGQNPGTIRGDYCLRVGRNICHGSDSVENTERENGLWFEPDAVLTVSWENHSKDWIYE